jgi:hypothetical protein
MNLHLLSDDERRAHCRRELEALEHWLRRLIDETFSAAHGPDYLEAVDQGGRQLIKNEVRRGIAERRAKEPLRYQRPVDAAHLDDLVTIVCKPEHWQQHFRTALSEAFPHGNDEARTFLTRLVDIRNKVSHANPISVHEAARVICYTLDVIEGLKACYRMRNLESEYNVPRVLRVSDSLGNVCYPPAMPGYYEGGVWCNFNATPLRPGECLSIEVEIDPSFDRSNYHFRWVIGNNLLENYDERRLAMEIENRHVSQQFTLLCHVTSTKEWHRLGQHDDFVGVVYKVLPPLS